MGLRGDVFGGRRINTKNITKRQRLIDSDSESEWWREFDWKVEKNKSLRRKK